RCMSRVLIVEDEVHLAKGLQFNLEAEGHSVEVVGDGEQALEILLGPRGEATQKTTDTKRPEEENGRREDFDAVVLDVMLPGKDGFAVTAELRAAKHFVPVLMLTARGRPEDVLKGFASGADDYLPKPFELAILLARLQGLLRRSQWQRSGPHASEPAFEGNGTKTAQTGDVFSFRGKTLDFGTLELITNRGKIQLTLMESDLLKHLVQSNGQVVSRKSILEEVWGLKEDT